jgi:G:T-mismatch repair DNA endonuclease (very short patch repair protein)
MAKRNSMSLINLFKMATIILPVIILTFIQPDLGTTIVMVVAIVAILLFSKFPKYYFILAFSVFGILSMPIWNSLKEYQKENSEKLKKKKEEKPELFEDVGWNQKKYWIKKGMSEEESIRKISELQKTFTLESCIEKYGKEEGKKKWLDRQEKWKAKVFNEFTNIARGTSKMSSDFINDLINRINFNGTFLYDKEEKFINCPQKNRSFKYDFTYTERKKIIEINGDFWHCNPEIFKDDSQIHKVTNKSVKDIREMDIYKIKLAEKHGYSVFCIWESDIRKKREESLNKCLEFLKN